MDPAHSQTQDPLRATLINILKHSSEAAATHHNYELLSFAKVTMNGCLTIWSCKLSIRDKSVTFWGMGHKCKIERCPGRLATVGTMRQGWRLQRTGLL